MPSGERPWERLALTIPTTGSNDEALRTLISNSGLPEQRVFVVLTRDLPHFSPPGSVLVDLDPINIHRWWNLGLDAAARSGARWVAVANDDALISPSTLPELLEAMLTTQATIASPGKRFHHYRGGLPLRYKMDGSLWILDLNHGLRPDEGYRWWQGDRELEIQARLHYRGVVTQRVDFHHEAGTATFMSEELSALAYRDQVRFAERHRVIDTLRKRLRVIDR